MKLTTMDYVWAVLQRVLTYNLLEVSLAVGLLVAYTNDVVVWPVVLWGGFIMAAMYVLATSMSYAQEFAKEQVLERTMYILDFFSGALILLGLAWIVKHEDWQFSAMFLLAAAQHLRYTCLSIKWLLEQDRDANGHTNDKM